MAEKNRRARLHRYAGQLTDGQYDPDRYTGASYPSSHEEWCQRYERLEAAYLGDSYTEGEIRENRLFRALDTDGEVIAETRRLTRDVAHVVDTDAQAIVRGRLVLEADSGSDSDLADGEEVWRRSRVRQHAGRWARRNAILGDLHLEAARDVDGSARILAYDPSHVVLTYDAQTGSEIERAVITVRYFDPPAVDSYGGVSDVNTVSHVYQRVIDRDGVLVTVDGQAAPGSGPHRLGCVPLVHVPFIPWKEPEHGLWAATGLEAPLAYIDSILTQILAIGNRFGNPILWTRGFKLGGSSDVFKHGYVISGLNAGGGGANPADMGYLEYHAEIVRLLEAAQASRDYARETLPEFLFTDSGANASGEALNYRASAFVSKMEEIRGRWYDALCRVTQYAVAMDRGQAHDPDVDLYRIDAPPVLPVNTRAELMNLHDVLDHKGLTRVDYVRHLQRLAIVPADVDPEEYAIEVQDESADRAATFFGTRPPGSPGFGQEQEVPEEEEADADEQDEEAEEE